MNYVSAKEAKRLLQVNGTTLKVWKDSGRLKYKKLSEKKILYDVDSVLLSLDTEHKRRNIIYARVSNTKQKNDLDNQIEMIKSYCISHGIEVDAIYKEIASGMNENRKELNMLIDEVISGNVQTVFISFRDRLSRFGFDYFKNLFAKYNTEIKILDEFEETNKTFQEELTEDLISIIHHFSMKLYSNRRKKFKEIESILNSEC